MASFYLVVWQVFIWLFGKFSLGYLASIQGQQETMDIKSMPTVQIIQALGKRFREYRIAARMTQKEVAGQSGVSLLTIRRFEQGYSYDIKLGNLIALLKAIDFADGIADILPEFPVSPYALARQEANKPKRVRHGQQH